MGHNTDPGCDGGKVAKVFEDAGVRFEGSQMADAIADIVNKKAGKVLTKALKKEIATLLGAKKQSDKKRIAAAIENLLPKTSSGALDLYNDNEFLRAVKGMVGCDELADRLLTASGNAGELLTVNSIVGGDFRVMENGRMITTNFHQVYCDGRFVFDPRCSLKGPIPKVDWEAEIFRLNGNRVSIDPSPKG